MFFLKKPEPISWIAVFLGNPGLRYENTRHNIGFITADIIADKLNININRAKFNALTVVVTFGDEKVLLVKPQTYMNLSGNAVWPAMKFHKTSLDRVIVVSDEVSLPVGKLRIRRSGSAGGHNGLRSIISKCGGECFPRIRIGVGSPPHEEYDLADWVLSPLRGEDQALAFDAARQAAAAVEMIIMQGVDFAMSRFNLRSA